MPLTDDQEQLEHELRVRQMTTNIEQMNANIEKMRHDIRLSEKQLARQTVALVVTAMGVVVGAFAAGAAWWNYFGSHH
jgi:uncharacterized membrane protein YoaK (UPF0700 family)